MLGPQIQCQVTVDHFLSAHSSFRYDTQVSHEFALLGTRAASMKRHGILWSSLEPTAEQAL